MRVIGTSKTCVWRWQQRFMEEGTDGLLIAKTRPSRIPPLDEAITEPMLGCDTVIESPCRGCGEPVRLATCDNGNALRRVAPSTAVVWSGICYAGRLLRDLWLHGEGVFCSDRHLAAWRERTEPRRHRVPAHDRGRLADRQGHLRADARRASHQPHETSGRP